MRAERDACGIGFTADVHTALLAGYGVNDVASLVFREVRRQDDVRADEQIASFEKAWLEVIAEESAKDPLFKKISDDYLDFRKKYKVWGDAQALKPTYQKH